MITLETELSRIRGLNDAFLKKLAKLGILTVQNLLWHFPNRYEDFSRIIPIAELTPGTTVTIRGVVKKIEARKSWKRRLQLIEAIIADDTGGIKAIWFNQIYIARVLRPGMEANFSGKVTLGKQGIYLASPSYEIVRERMETRHTAGLIPIYPETKGLTSRGLRYLIKPILEVLPKIPDFLPTDITRKNNFPNLSAALHSIHFPKTITETEQARKRFAYEDLFLLQLHTAKLRRALRENKAPIIKISDSDLQTLLSTLPFSLTPSQKQSLQEILDDLTHGTPMNRLLQGDVGSGKTIVIAIAALLVAIDGGQVAFMAPTEILARQHFQTLHTFFADFLEKNKIKIGLLTSGVKTAEKKLIYSLIANNEIHIIIGTHALLQKEAHFPKLALVVIDEQHRFGVDQRAQLVGRRSTQIERGETPKTEKNPELLHEDVTYKIRKAIFNVYNALGPGQKESVYQKALAIEFETLGLKFEKEKRINTLYNGQKIGFYQPDFVIEDKIILEIKAENYIGKTREKQTWNYLKGSQYRVALLANFGSKEIEIKRIVYDTARDLHKSEIHPRSSASYLRESAPLPHFLSMSATPIPRTLSLSLFGDLDLSLIQELPQGRKPIITKIVAPENRTKAYVFVKEHILKGEQMFVICPRIEVNTANPKPLTTNHQPLISKLWDDAKTVTEEHKKLSLKIFPEFKIGMIHGKLKSKEKEHVMHDFKEKKLDILVATSVIEVGVDVPNATMMMIEGAEHFGLAQLHQFRGRVGRGERQSYCLLFTESESKSVEDRLTALVKAKNGFELAELDLMLRGPGEFLGDKQTGLPDIAMQALKNTDLLKQAREDAVEILNADPELKTLPELHAKLEDFKKEIHLE